MTREEKLSWIKRKGYQIKNDTECKKKYRGSIRAQKNGTIITGTVNQIFDDLFGCGRRMK